MSLNRSGTIVGNGAPVTHSAGHWPHGRDNKTYFHRPQEGGTLVQKHVGYVSNPQISEVCTADIPFRSDTAGLRRYPDRVFLLGGKPPRGGYAHVIQWHTLVVPTRGFHKMGDLDRCPVAEGVLCTTKGTPA